MITLKVSKKQSSTLFLENIISENTQEWSNWPFAIILGSTWDSSYEKIFHRILTHMETTSKKLSWRVSEIYLMIKHNSCTYWYLWYNVNRRGDSKNSTTHYRISSWEFSESYKSNTVQKAYFKLTSDIFS